MLVDFPNPARHHARMTLFQMVFVLWMVFAVGPLFTFALVLRERYLDLRRGPQDDLKTRPLPSGISGTSGHSSRMPSGP